MMEYLTEVQHHGRWHVMVIAFLFFVQGCAIGASVALLMAYRMATNLFLDMAAKTPVQDNSSSPIVGSRMGL